MSWSAIPATMPSFQANRFSPSNAEIEAVVESQGPRARRRLTLVGGHDVAQHPSASQFDVRATVPDCDDSVEVANRIILTVRVRGVPSMKFLRVRSTLSRRL